MNFLLARLSDGSSFKFIRFAPNFQTVVDTIDGGGSPTNKDSIDYTEHRLWSVPGRLTVSPQFWGRLGYFYTSDDDLTSFLRVYEYNPIIKAPELKCINGGTSETSQSMYHEFSLVSVGDFGVIFKEQGGSTWTRYLCDPDTGSMSSANPTFTDPGTLGTLTVAGMTLF